MPGLSITRKAGESVRIGDIHITIISVGEKQVRLQIVAPRDIDIVRTEIDTTGDAA